MSSSKKETKSVFCVKALNPKLRWQDNPGKDIKYFTLNGSKSKFRA